MSRKVIKFKYQLKIIFYYFQKRHSINWPDSLSPQWNCQVVIRFSARLGRLKQNDRVATNLFCLGVIGHRKRLIISQSFKIN